MPHNAQHVGKTTKLIEVSLPLETINRESAREKSVRHGHPSTLHLWWARRPLAAARAILFAQLVDDPASRPDLYPTEEDQILERKKLHELIERLVVWENINDHSLLRQAHQKILESTGGTPPSIFDPFAGGGTIPLEAQRLGLHAYASDLNPVAVLINKALIEFPPRFAGQPPVFPNAAAETVQTWPRATGLAEDIRRYGSWIRDEAARRIGRLYPSIVLPDSSSATVIAWIWAHTITCANPACGIRMPLVRTWWLCKRKTKLAYVIPIVTESGIRFTVGYDAARAPAPDADGTVGRTGATCVRCGASVALKYVRAEGQAGRMSRQLMAIVAAGNRSRIYLEPTDDHAAAADIDRPVGIPDELLPKNPRDFKTPNYGMSTFADLFTPRQLTALTTFSDLVNEVRTRIETDALTTGWPTGARLEDGGCGAQAYSEAIATYLGLVTSRCADYWSAICSWHNTGEKMRNTFGRQAIPMVWDFAECNPFSSASGSYAGQLAWTAKACERTPAQNSGVAVVADASTVQTGGRLISTDPPYYDNIDYSDLSDFFYVWLRRSLREVYPGMLATMLVPKDEELVANPYRHGGRQGARLFFEGGFRAVFQQARADALADFPITIYYAFKQQDESIDGHSSTGWETLLEAMIHSGWTITATWPLRSELRNRMLASGTNALASSIVLTCRPRPRTAPRTDRRGFLSALKDELPGKLRELQHGSIAPVDLPQAAIGPGMAVYSRYSEVIEPDGSPMTVRQALQRINAALDEVLTEQENDFDGPTRFALTWFRNNSFDTGEFGDAENIANARGVRLDHLRRLGIVRMGGGKVTLVPPAELSAEYEPSVGGVASQWEVVMRLTDTLVRRGIPDTAALLNLFTDSVDLDLCNELANLLFTIAESNKKPKIAIEFNNLGAAWNDIARMARTTTSQPTLSA